LSHGFPLWKWNFAEVDLGIQHPTDLPLSDLR